MESDNILLELKTYKNYKELCKAMNWTVSSGNTKKAQIKQLDLLCKYHKEGNKFIIDNIYDTPIKKIDNRGNSSWKNFKNFNIDKKDENNIGVYRIINYDTKEVYIGSTIRGFRTRFKEHNRGDYECMLHTYNLLHNGGFFEIIESMNNYTEKEIRLKEQYYIDKYLNYKDYKLINHFNEVSYSGKVKKFKKLKIDEKDLDLAIKLLKENNIKVY